MRICVFLLLTAAVASGDEVTLKNGDRVTGEIVKKDEKALTVKSEFLGTLTIAWEQVRTVKANTPVTVVLKSGQEMQSTLEAVDTAQVAEIRNAAEQRLYERMRHPKLYDFWEGTGTFGVAGTTGNSQTRTIHAAMVAERVTRTDKTVLRFDAIKSTSVLNRVKADTAQSIRGGVGYDHNLTHRLFANVFNDYEYDRFQNLDLRATFGGGLGLHVWKKGERGFLDVLAGGDYDRAKFGASIGSKSKAMSAAEVFWGNEFAYKLGRATAFTQSFRMFNNLTETGTYRVNGDIGLNTRIMKWLNWNIAMSDRYLSEPSPGRKRNDLIYTTGLGITFSLK
jgi:putative salt-induced outer membrane protein YdiY